MRFIFLMITSFVFLSGCVNQHKIARKYMNEDAFPTDLPAPHYTLLVMKWTKSWASWAGNDESIARFNEKLEKTVKELRYPAIAVSKEDLTSGKYDDVNKYRYIIQPYEPMHRLYTEGSGLGYQMELYFTDRKEGKIYPSTNYKLYDYRSGIKQVLAFYE